MIWIELFLTFLKIGAFTFGGGYAMLPLIESEVEHHGWLTQAEVVDFIMLRKLLCRVNGSPHTDLCITICAERLDRQTGTVH